MRYISENQLKVLAELTKTLNDYSIAFVIIGGLASITWGSKRTLVDIDILVSGKNFNEVAGIFKENIIAGPRHYTKNNWDIYQFILEIRGVKIDVCNGENLFFINSSGRKHCIKSNINRPVFKVIDELRIPVLPLDELIRYKRLIARPVDIEDLSFIDYRH